MPHTYYGRLESDAHRTATVLESAPPALTYRIIKGDRWKQGRAQVAAKGIKVHLPIRPSLITSDWAAEADGVELQRDFGGDVRTR